MKEKIEEREQPRKIQNYRADFLKPKIRKYSAELFHMFCTLTFLNIMFFRFR